MTFAIRGIIEGFYGRPWSHGARLDMIDFIAELGMNVYAYSPKDDPFLRSRWRDPLDDRSRRATQELITACGERDIDLWYCVSPGLTVEYGSDSEVDALVSRFSEIAEHGVRSFGVFLDDIPTRLQHTEDRGAYGDLVEAQLDFLARTHRALGARVPGARLIVCPTRYWGRGDEPGISRFGSGLPAGVELLWTGRQICSATIDRDDARRVELASGRRPIFWDNYPVNDVAMAGELHIGPFRGRSADLDSAATGLIANVMELAEASKIALATIADYLRDPAGYDPDRSWAAAIERLIPEPADRAAFVDFAENSLSSCLAEDDALRLTAALDRLAFLTHLGRPEEGAAGLLELASRYRTAAGRLRSPHFSAPHLAGEIRPWVDAFALGADVIERIGLAHLDGSADEPARRAEWLAHRDRLRATGLRVFGDVLDMTLTDLSRIHTTTTFEGERPCHQDRSHVH